MVIADKRHDSIDDEQVATTIAAVCPLEDDLFRRAWGQAENMEQAIDIGPRSVDI